MILFLRIFISTNLPIHTDNPIKFKSRNKYYAVLRWYRGKEWWSQILMDAVKTEQILEKTKEQKAKVLKERDERLGDIAPRVGEKGTCVSNVFFRQQNGRA